MTRRGETRHIEVPASELASEDSSGLVAAVAPVGQGPRWTSFGIPALHLSMRWYDRSPWSVASMPLEDRTAASRQRVWNRFYSPMMCRDQIVEQVRSYEPDLSPPKWSVPPPPTHDRGYFVPPESSVLTPAQGS